MSKQTQAAIRTVCNDLADFLCEKNAAYGDSAVNPVRIRSTASAKEQILVRQDDKLNRIINGGEYAGDDDLKDLVGYWVLEQAVDILAGSPVQGPPRDAVGAANRSGVGVDPKNCCELSGRGW